MRKAVYLLILCIFSLTGCEDDDINSFEQSADERAAEAIANLKQDLVATPYKALYRPEPESGAFWVLLDFNEDNTVRIRSDLGANEGQFFDQTITYRIDNSLGLELIFETYSFFSFLFELDQATFGAEFEFDYANKTPDNALVFTSKSDFGQRTVFTLLPATPADEALLGVELSENINLISSDFAKVFPTLELRYEDKDIGMTLGIATAARTISIPNVYRKSNPTNLQAANFSTSYIIEGDQLIFETPLTGTFFNIAVNISSITFDNISESVFNGCATPIETHLYNGVTSANDNIILQSSLYDPSGLSFSNNDFFSFSPFNVINQGQSAGEQIQQDISGAVAAQLYYNFQLNQGLFSAIGFVIQNPDGTNTFALREFTATFDGNRMIFNFEPEVSIFGNPDTPANTDNVNIYLEALTEGDQTYVSQINSNAYEFHNPCTGWSIVFVAPQ